ncbi:MAG: DUF4831 family protein [Bacteroidaceae bacterium]|nr:DUF4831 family protein [Bacteroidaceae bacterium]
MKHTTSIRALFLSLVFGLYLFLPSVAQTIVKNYEPGVSRDGIVYFLPKTAVDITLTAAKISYMPGELCSYADRYMRLTDVSDKEDVHYELLSANVAYHAVADESKCYHIAFNNNSIAPQVALSDEGTLLSICAGELFAMSSEEVNTPTTEARWEVKDARDYMTEEMLMATSKAKLAELVAREIYEIRESKNSLIRGESDYMPSDGEGLKLMIDNLQKQEDALLKLFTGATTREITSKTFSYLPEGNTTKHVAARFSRKLGILDADDMAGAPIYLDVKNLNPNADPTTGLTPTVQKKQQALTVRKIKKNPIKELNDSTNTRGKVNYYDGIVYNLPAKANVRVYTPNNVFVDETASIPQFGTTETLSAKLFGKKATTKVQLNPITGALLRIEE